MAASMLHVISLKLKPQLSKGILIAFSKSTGSKGKRERVAYQQAVATNFPARLLNSIIVVSLLEETARHNVGSYVCFSIGFVSAVPVRHGVFVQL